MNGYGTAPRYISSGNVANTLNIHLLNTNAATAASVGINSTHSRNNQAVSASRVSITAQFASPL